MQTLKDARILFLRSNPIDPDPRVEKESRTLVEAGYQVQILGWDRSAELPPIEDKDGVRITRLAIKAAYAKGLMNLKALMRWEFGLLRWLIRNRRNYQIIHACDFDTVLPAIIVKWLFKKRVIYDIFDFYADHLRATPKFIKAIIRVIDRSIINKADGVILVDESRHAQLGKVLPKRLVIIYNSPLDQGIPFPKPKLEGSQFTITYVGLLQVERGLLLLLDILENYPNWTLLLAGFGGDSEIILDRARRLPNVEFFGRVSYEQALQLSQKADVLIATYDPSIPNHRYSSPNKIFEAMMLGKPIIVAKNTNMDRIISEENCGLIIEYGNRDELEAALLNLSTNENLRYKLGENGRLAYEKHYDWEIMKQKLLLFYNDLLNTIN